MSISFYTNFVSVSVDSDNLKLGSYNKEWVGKSSENDSIKSQISFKTSRGKKNNKT